MGPEIEGDGNEGHSEFQEAASRRFKSIICAFDKTSDLNGRAGIYINPQFEFVTPVVTHNMFYTEGIIKGTCKDEVKLYIYVFGRQEY